MNRTILVALLLGLSACGGGSSEQDVCGDSRVSGAETCDDGNAQSGDGCSASCQVESGFACEDAPSVCTAVCGDGLLAGDETCDDGDAAPGDGCSPTCEVEPGFECTGDPQTCASVCGDGQIVGAEACDDGNTAAGDGCSAACTVETGFACAGEPSQCAPGCGDGIISGPETCDDGGEEPGDGCSAACTTEPGYTCEGAPSICVTLCGDGVAAGDEACDDGDTDSADGCSATCEVEAGYTCSGTPSTCVTTCGDGFLVSGVEACDDGNPDGDDGCSATCTVEDGWSCAGVPSVCATSCGDGLIRGDEACDDGLIGLGEGCDDSCEIAPGFTCVGEPSSCFTTCGDGIRAGAELCDDGNVDDGDGCNSQCQPSTGESCLDTMGVGQAVSAAGTFTWTIPALSVTTADGAFSCDPNGIGPDAVIAYTKTSDTVANGGELLQIRTENASATTAQHLNVEVTTGACDPSAAQSLKCLWYKRDWDVYLDVPPGTYYVWIAKNSAATSTVGFPDVTVHIAEVEPVAAEGEGCFAPYTAQSAIYTAPVSSGQPHVWSIPSSINSFDMGATWGGPGSISCDDHATYGDIHGVDAVVEFNKTSGSSILQVQVTNLAPTSSNLNVEVLSVCDPTDSANVSRACRANSDSHFFTAGGPAGPVYVWVSTEATSEEFGGATVEITEIFPGVGESWNTAEPLTTSGGVTPSSTRRLDAPSCMPAGANVHWYAYTFTQSAVTLGTNAAGPVGLLDAGGQEVACVADASVVPLGRTGAPGETVYLAIPVGGAVTGFTLTPMTYAGVLGPEEDLQVTFPQSAVTEFGMAVDANALYLGGTGVLFSMPKTLGATATVQSTATAQLGYDLEAAGGSLFSVDSTTTTTASRLFRMYDGAAWTTTPWDLTPSYPSSAGSYALTQDGTSLYMATRRTTTQMELYAFSLTTPSVPTLLGSNNTVWYVVGLAADDQYFYVASNGTAGEGVYRLSRANLSAPAQKLATVDTTTTSNGLEVDAFVSPSTLYVRDAAGNIHAVLNPGGPQPAHVGVITSLGGSADYGMTYDHAAGALYFFETETSSTGRIRRMTKAP